MCNVPIPAFTAHNQMAVTTTQGAQIPQQVCLPFLLEKNTFSSVTVLLLCCLSSDCT
jgi:hypothetical protein